MTNRACPRIARLAAAAAIMVVAGCHTAKTPRAVSPVDPATAQSITDPAPPPAAPPSPKPVAVADPKIRTEPFDTLDWHGKPVWKPQDFAAERAELPADAVRFADDGDWFKQRDPRFAAPPGYRISAPIGPGGFLTVEAYSRQGKDLEQLLQIVDDPLKPGNTVLRLASPEHTDATLIRTTKPLGTRYRICASIGAVTFGTGEGKNGYQGDEQAGPWLRRLATDENGCYFGALSRVPPKPHNNILAHHLRIAFIDSDNNPEGWTKVWNGKKFVAGGRHPIMIAVPDATKPASDENGPPLIAFAADQWHRGGTILAAEEVPGAAKRPGHRGKLHAADAYRDTGWYTVCLERVEARLTLRISGDFRHGGLETYEAVLLDGKAAAHFDDPHYWFLGDPHINYYEGSVLIDDITLETLGGA